eukprot:g4584.t1
MPVSLDKDGMFDLRCTHVDSLLRNLWKAVNEANVKEGLEFMRGVEAMVEKETVCRTPTSSCLAKKFRDARVDVLLLGKTMQECSAANVKAKKGSCEDLQKLRERVDQVVHQYASVKDVVEHIASALLQRAECNVPEKNRRKLSSLPDCTIPSAGFYELTESCRLTRRISVLGGKTLTIVGVGTPTIDREENGWHFDVYSGCHLNVTGLTLTNGVNKYGNGGAVRILSGGMATFSNSSFTFNSAKDGKLQTCNSIDPGYFVAGKGTGATQQIECPPGTFSRRYALECMSCPIGWFQPSYRSAACLECAKGKSTLGNGSRICVGKDCTVEEYLNDTSPDFSAWTCEACPEGAVCDAVADATWSAVIAKGGYYRMPGPAPQSFVKCPTASACLGSAKNVGGKNLTEECDKRGGHANSLLCERCLPGHAKSARGSCQKCANAIAVFCVGIFCAFLMTAYLFRRVRSAMRRNGGRSRSIEMDLLKILLNSSYCLGILMAYPIEFPSALSPLLQIGQAISSLQSDALSVECLLSDSWGGSKYLQKNGVALIIPPGGILVAGFGWTCRYLCLWKSLSLAKDNSRRQQQHHAAAETSAQLRRYVTVNYAVTVIIILFVTLPSLSRTATSMMVCTNFGLEGSPVRLRGDPEVICWENDHLAYFFGAALPATLVYIIAFPLAGIAVLRKHRREGRLWKSGTEDPAANIMLFLYSGFVRERYYWEFVVFARKVALSLVMVMTADGQASGLLGLIILQIASVLQLYCKPYRRRIVNLAESGALQATSVAIYIGLFFYLPDARQSVTLIVLSVIVAGFTILYLFVLLGAIIHNQCPSVVKRCPILETVYCETHTVQEKTGIEMKDRTKNVACSSEKSVCLELGLKAPHVAEGWWTSTSFTHAHTLNRVLGRYPLHWPGGVLTVFDSVGSLFSAAGDVISFSFAMDDKDGSRYFRSSAIVLGGPLLIVMCIGIFWAAKAATAKNEELKNIRDFDEICGDSNHMGYMIGLALPFLLAYTFGVPALTLILLRRMKRSNKLFATREESYSANVYKFLYGGYNEKTYYWESVIMLRKIVLNVVLVVLSFTALHVINIPCSDTLLNRIEMGSLLLSCGVLYAGLFLFDDGLLSGLKTMITALMLTALFLSVLIF